MRDESIRLPEPDLAAVQTLVDALDRAYEARLSDEQMQPLVQAVWDSPPEVRIVTWTTIAQRRDLPLAKWVHRFIAPAVLDVFGVPMGEAGIGVVPKKILLHNQ